jgi:hypothetical protein
MKTIQDLFQLVAEAVADDKLRAEYDRKGKWFIDFSGHVNGLSIRYYITGWDADKGVADERKSVEHCNVYLTTDGVQEAYWFINNRLNK